MRGDSLRHSFRKFFVPWMKRQKMFHRGRKTVHILGLHFLTAPSIRNPTLRKTLRRSLRLQVRLNTLDRFCRRPDSPVENFPTTTLLHNPVITGRFNASSQCGVSRRHKLPLFRNRPDLAILSPHCPLSRSRQIHVLRHPLAHSRKGTNLSPADHHVRLFSSATEPVLQRCSLIPPAKQKNARSAGSQNGRFQFRYRFQMPTSTQGKSISRAPGRQAGPGSRRSLPVASVRTSELNPRDGMSSSISNSANCHRQSCRSIL